MHTYILCVATEINDDLYVFTMISCLVVGISQTNISACRTDSWYSQQRATGDLFNQVSVFNSKILFQSLLPSQKGVSEETGVALERSDCILVSGHRINDEPRIGISVCGCDCRNQHFRELHVRRKTLVGRVFHIER